VGVEKRTPVVASATTSGGRACKKLRIKKEDLSLLFLNGGGFSFDSKIL